MKFTARKSLPHEMPSWVPAGSTYFFTLCVRDREDTSLCRREVAVVLLEAARNYHMKQHWWVRLFLLMPDHLHALISLPRDESIRESWENWKRYTAKQTGVIWQWDFFEHRIRSGESWDEKERYIKENPVRHGLVADVKLWPWVFEP